MPRNVVFLYFENTVLIVIRLHVLSVYSFDVSVTTSTFSTAGMMHDPDYIPYKKKKKSGKYTEKCFPLAFSALHLRYYCSF